MNNHDEEIKKLIDAAAWGLRKAWSFKGWDVRRLIEERDRISRAIELLQQP